MLTKYGESGSARSHGPRVIPRFAVIGACLVWDRFRERLKLDSPILTNLAILEMARFGQTPLSDLIRCCQGVGPQSKVSAPQTHMELFDYYRNFGKSRIIQEAKLHPEEGRTFEPLTCYT